MNKPLQPLPDHPLLAAIYAGPLNNQSWDDAVECSRQLLDGSSGSMFFSWSLGAKKDYFHLVDDIHAVGPGMSVRYSETFRALDPFHYDDMVPGEVYQIDQYISRPLLLQSPYYLDFMRPAGVEYIACLHVAEPGGMRAWLVVSRSKLRGPFSDDDIDFLRSLAPHFERALAMFGKLKRTELERDIFSDVVRGLTIGTVILNQNLTVIAVNPIAEKLLTESDELFLKNGHLRLKSPNRNKELEQLLRESTKGSDGQEPTAMRIPTGTGHFLCLLIRRIPKLQVRQQNDEVPRLIVYLNDPASNKIAPASMVSTLFGLTPAESTLAVLLAGGMSIGEAAQQMNINENSARTNLKRIFAKTGLHRQAELVSLILKSLATLGVTDADIGDMQM